MFFEDTVWSYVNILADWKYGNISAVFTQIVINEWSAFSSSNSCRGAILWHSSMKTRWIPQRYGHLKSSASKSDTLSSSSECLLFCCACLLSVDLVFREHGESIRQKSPQMTLSMTKSVANHGFCKISSMCMLLMGVMCYGCVHEIEPWDHEVMISFAVMYHGTMHS